MKDKTIIPEEIKVQDFFHYLNTYLQRGNQRSNFNEFEINKLKEYFHSVSNDILPEDIYAESYLDFFIKYGYANVVKNYFVLNELEELGLSFCTKKILDIGSGPGVLPVSLLLSKHEKHLNSTEYHNVELLDCTSQFHDLFKAIWRLIPMSEKKDINISYKNELFIGNIDKKFDPTLIVLSNSLGELLRDKRFNLDLFIKSLKEINPVIILIDYYYESLNKMYNDFFKRIGESFNEVSIYEWPSWNKGLKFIDLGPISHVFGKNRRITSNVRFIKGIYVPKQTMSKLMPPIHVEIVQKYKYAWQSHDIELLRSLFTEDAIYSISDNKPPLIGIKKIEKYWLENEREQKFVQFFPNRISIDSDTVCCEWVSIFYRIDLGRWLLLKGNFQAQLRGNRICYFKENFIKQKFDVKPSFNE